VTALVTAAEVKQAEQEKIGAGTEESMLMFLAGTEIADRILQTPLRPMNVVILSGPGNNGGDGIVIGVTLAEFNCDVVIWCWNRPEPGEIPVSDEQLDMIALVDSRDELVQALDSADIVVDAVFGAGSRSELPAEVIEAFDEVRAVQQRRCVQVWAVDVPSGVSSDEGTAAEGALQSDVTAMIGLPKIGAFQQPASQFTGEIQYIDIGLSEPDGIEVERPQLITARYARQVLPSRRTGIHKRSAGTLMVIGGAPNYFGAPRLTAEAAMRTGTGLVSVAAPSSVIGSIATAVPELTFVPLPASEHFSTAGRMTQIVQEHWSSTDALVIGPGLGTDAPVPDFLSQLLGFDGGTSSSIGFGTHSDPEPAEPFSGKAVIDADGLNWLATQENWWEILKGAELVLTPHPGELGRLMGVERSEIESDPWEHAKSAAHKFHQVVVLKYAHSVIATPDGQMFVAHQAPVGLATAGTGDVLSGVIGGLLAQGCDATGAAIAGVRLALDAALFAASSDGQIGYLATDIIRQIPAAREMVSRTRSGIS
jgi:ADP-dependent NAD(P)H-hydrate dehydratase / NAD(P)H-hydrate epimerase